MTKSRTSIFIIGMLVVVIAASLLTVFALFMTGTIVTDRIALVYEVRNENKEYDGTPLCAEYAELVSGELQKNHHAEIGFLGEQTDVGASESSVSVRIFDEEGYDVTDEYKIGVKGGSLNVYQRDIAVKLDSDGTVIYNGSKVDFEDYEVTEGELVVGHRVIGTQTATLINAEQELPDDIKPAVVDAMGRNVTNNYNIVSFEIGDNVKVVPREITVKPADIDKVYDGKEDPIGLEVLSGSLAEGQRFEFEINDGDVRFLDACKETPTNITSISVWQTIDGGTDDIETSENYKITYLPGHVKIAKCPLTITAPSMSWVYDGEVHDPNDEEDFPKPVFYGLVEADKESSKDAVVSYENTITEAGTCPNTIDEKNFKFSEKDNYEIVYVPGTLTVTPLEITVETKSASKVYNGEPLEVDEPETSIPEGSGFKLKTEREYPKITNVSSVENKVVYYLTYNGEEVDKDNYRITYHYGTLEITPCVVNVTLKDIDDLTYNGAVQTEWEETAIDLEPADDGGNIDHLDPARDFRIVPSETVKNAGDYTYYVEFVNGGDIANHTLKFTGDKREGNITVNKCVVNVTLKDIPARTYNGAVQTITADEAMEIDDVKDGLEVPHLTKADFIIKTVTGETIKNAGKYTYRVAFANDGDAPNHIIQITGGENERKITVNKAEVTVTLKKVTQQYDAEAHTISLAEAVNSIEPTEGEPAIITKENMGDYLEITTATNEILKNAKVYEYGIRLRHKEDINNITLNITGEGKYEITKFAAEFSDTIESQTKEYDGKALTVDAGKMLELQQSGKAISFVTGFSLTYTSTDSTPGNYDDAESLYVDLHVYGKNGEEITDNLDITLPEIPSLTISTRNIEFTLDPYFCNSEDEIPWQIDPNAYLHCSLETSGLGFSVSINSNVIVVNKKNHTLTVYDLVGFVTIKNADGEDVTDHFKIVTPETDYWTSNIIVMGSKTQEG